MTLEELVILDRVVRCRHNLLSEFVADCRKAEKILEREIKLKTMKANLSEETDNKRNARNSR